jgi:hypothetical protein
MEKVSFLLNYLIFWSIVVAGQVFKSPAAFLGYELGSQFTPHHQIVGYFREAQAANTHRMKLVQYGLTNEGRPLLLAIVASQQNMRSLEAIRENNLRLTGLCTDRPGDLAGPAIVWLSFGVHGDEAGCSEASMKVLYELLNSVTASAELFLKNTVVIIDPCLNPDGHNRYVNWFMQTKGDYADPDPVAREHQEPWPGGRYNHYYFDLNRDWAWQTQLETQLRMVQYNRWMPTVHGDFHEWGYNHAYTFTPAEPPYHELITPFQKEFQGLIAKKIASRFEHKGWRYFTKAADDLCYPSYGDTYPLFSGSVGISFEQEGGGAAGSVIDNGNGNMLTLQERVDRHFTIAMATLETVAENSIRLVNEFKKFFDNEKDNEKGAYTSFVIPAPSGNTTDGLKRLLDFNGIAYGISRADSLIGYNYFTAHVEPFSAKNALVVSAYQPKGVLAKVLFEPRTRLVDSATYDITAWSLPFVYGLLTYAVKGRVPFADCPEKQTGPEVPPAADGYLIDYQSFEDAKFLASIIRVGIKVSYAERDFFYNGKKYARGTLHILKKGNEAMMEAFGKAATEHGVCAAPLSSEFGKKLSESGAVKLRMIGRPLIVLLTGEGVVAAAAGEVWHLFDQQLQYPLSLVNAKELGKVDWKNTDVIILPNGKYSFNSDPETLEDLKRWVQQGGKLIAIDNAVAQMADGDWGLNEIKRADQNRDKKLLSFAELKKMEEGQYSVMMSNVAGAIYKTELDTTHPLAFGIGRFFYVLKRQATLYERLKEGGNVGVIKRGGFVAGLVRGHLKAIQKEGLSFGVQRYGRGSVVYFADDPIFRCFWEKGKMLFSNAVFFVGQHP